MGDSALLSGRIFCRCRSKIFFTILLITGAQDLLLKQNLLLEQNLNRTGNGNKVLMSGEKMLNFVSFMCPRLA